MNRSTNGFQFSVFSFQFLVFQFLREIRNIRKTTKQTKIPVFFRLFRDFSYVSYLSSSLKSKCYPDLENAIPEGFHTLTPYFSVPEATQFIEFLKKAFNAENPTLGNFPPSGQGNPKSAHPQRYSPHSGIY
jgi:hypothetical protein